MYSLGHLNFVSLGGRSTTLQKFNTTKRREYVSLGSKAACDVLFEPSVRNDSMKTYINKKYISYYLY